MTGLGYPPQADWSEALRRCRKPPARALRHLSFRPATRHRADAYTYARTVAQVCSLAGNPVPADRQTCARSQSANGMFR